MASSELTREHLASPVVGDAGTIRIPRELSAGIRAATSGGDRLNARAVTPEGESYPVVINLADRTLDGLDPWLKGLDPDERRAFSISVTSTDPLEIRVGESQGLAECTEGSDIVLQRPGDGLFLGGVLESCFHELVPTAEPYVIEAGDLVRHTFICGVTGAGKTVLGKALLEEAALNHIPAIAIDLKGDISSIGLFASGEDTAEFLSWVPASNQDDRLSVAEAEAAKHKSQLTKWGMGAEDITAACESVIVQVFTPRSNDGFRMAISAFPDPPDDIETMREEDADAYENFVDFSAKSFVSRLRVSRTLAEKAEGYVFEILKYAHANSIPMVGYEGVKRVLDEFQGGGFGIHTIGGMATDEYISSDDRRKLSHGVNALLSGAGRRSFEGWPLDIRTLAEPDPRSQKTPISVINLQHLDFDEQALVVSHVAFQIYTWMRRQATTDETPRLLFYIDEIGGGGGKRAFYPSTAISPCKPALSQLLKQGRAFGVCCVFATQNPGDIDYKGLSNCSTWMVGKLRTKRDRSKIKQGAADADLDFESAERFIPTLATGQFVGVTPSSTWTVFKERWLLGIHVRLGSKELRRLKEKYEGEAYSVLEAGRSALAAGDAVVAEQKLRDVIVGWQFSTHVSGAYLTLARLLIDLSRYEEAKAELTCLLSRWLEDEELAEAYYLLGLCHEHSGVFSAASDAFGRAVERAKSGELGERASLHCEYCTSRAVWPHLSGLKKLIWWIAGKRPAELAPMELVDEGGELSLRAHRSALAQLDLRMPPDLDGLDELPPPRAPEPSSEEQGADRRRTETWARKVALQIEKGVRKGDLQEAYSLAMNVIRRLQDGDVPAPDSVLKTLRSVDIAVASRRDSVTRKIASIEARAFEFEIANLLAAMGYDASVTRYTGDDGVDVFALRGSQKVVVQCKRWRKGSVGRAEVDELASVRDRHGADTAILAATCGFSAGADRVAREAGVVLWGPDDLYRLMAEHVQSRRSH